MSAPLLEAALEYAGKGWAVLPLCWPVKGTCSCGKADCTSPGKHPLGALVLHGLKDATKDPITIRAWWKKYPKANIGVLTGQASGIVVLDLDSQDAYKRVQSWKLPRTLTAKTGRGWHKFFKAPDFPIKTKTGFQEHIDLKGEGGYVVAAPSLHRSDVIYGWANDVSLAPLPQVILDLLGRETTAKAPAEEPEAAIPNGKRNTTLATLGVKMRRIGMSPGEILAALLERNRAACDPPLSPAEVETIARSVGKYEPGQAHLAPESAEVLMARTFEPIRWTAKPILAEGLGMLAGPPKIGKSWLALNLALAVATGRRFLSEYAADQGRVLFLGLEDGPRRLQDRLKMLLDGLSPFGGEQVSLDLLDYSTSIPKSTEGGLEMMDGWLAAHKDARLIVIDTLARLRRAPGRNANAYLSDTDFMAPLQKLALDHRCCILLVHHTRKGQAVDPLDAISGTTGLAGVADQCSILKRESRGKAEAILEITGRDFESLDIGLNSNEKMQWTFQGNADDLQKTRERQEIVDLLSETPGAPVSSSAIAKRLEKKPSAISRLLNHLSKDGIILPCGYGKYYVSK